MSEKPISPLRRRMIEDMTVRNFVEKTHNDYIRQDIYSLSRPRAGYGRASPATKEWNLGPNALPRGDRDPLHRHLNR